MPRSSLPPLGCEEAARWAERYRGLRPGRERFRTPEGSRFVADLKAACVTYGGPPLARALGLSNSAFYAMLRRRRGPVFPYPEEEQIQAAREAWVQVQRLRQSGRQARRTTPQYAAMHDQLKALLKHTDLRMVASALNLRRDRLAQFLRLPQRVEATRDPSRWENKDHHGNGHQ